MCRERKQLTKREDVGKGIVEMVVRGCHCFMEGLFDFIDTTATRKDIRFITEWHLRSIVGGQNYL